MTVEEMEQEAKNRDIKEREEYFILRLKSLLIQLENTQKQIEELKIRGAVDRPNNYSSGFSYTPLSISSH